MNFPKKYYSINCTN